MFKALYQKSLKLASHKNSKKYLAVISFAESSFFPIPPDIMIVPMVIAKKNDYKKIFLTATIFSALGGLLGYFLGSIFVEFALKIVEIYGYEEKVLTLKNDLSSGSSFYIFLATLFLAGFTPLPFKVFTITSGIIGFNIILFFTICLISRGLRFFFVSYVVYKFGNILNEIIERHTKKVFIILSILFATIVLTLFFTMS